MALEISWILAAIGLSGFGLAGYLDLKTTEFPDWIPYSMIALALAVRGIFAWLSLDWSVIANSAITGLAFLGVGMAMYFTKQWGDGDAWLLGALGFLFPDAAGFAYAGRFMFPVAVLFNFFLAAFLYIIAYSVIISLVTPGVCSGFARSFRGKCKGAILLVGGATAAYTAFIAALFVSFGIAPPSPLHAAAFPLLIAFVVVFSHYGMYIERYLFRKRIPVSKLRAGDVPAGSKWRMLKPEEVRKLKRRGGFIWIKEGVRFAPVFFITLLITLLFGDVFSMLFGLI